MLAISINRYFAIHIPLRAKLIFSRQNVAIIIVLIWIASFGAISPLLYQRRKTVRTLISLVIIFGVCWLPYYVVNIC
ncbi:QRFP-like peptide receptor [Patella vulgata]|uniref:QRFP-like peptide receptor n=1 Tax=Patella vulgata TaxID=6465 RepID=UPI0024A93F70|nr:QRFP-like peptide receptor [Patella vulgata]